MTKLAEVQNAADPRQVRRAERKERRSENRRLAAYKAMLGTAEGRYVFWDLLSKARIFGSIFHPSGSSLYYNAGRQDFGHELVADLIRADDDGYLLMEREQRARDKSDASELEAAHTPRAEENQGGVDGT